MRRVLLAIAIGVCSTALADSPKLVSAARLQTQAPVVYDGSYVRLAYPMGDVPPNRGVCTDVAIRAYRLSASTCKFSCTKTCEPTSVFIPSCGG
jgi:uncharacterized protein YijF (DUF1287 family)